MLKSHYKNSRQITSQKHKQSNNNVYNRINFEEKHVAKKLEIADRVEP